MFDKIKERLFFRRVEKHLFNTFKREAKGSPRETELRSNYFMAAYLLKAEMLLAGSEGRKKIVRSKDSFSLAHKYWIVAENERRRSNAKIQKAAEDRARELDALANLTTEELLERMTKLTSGEWAAYAEGKRRWSAKRASLPL